MSMSYSIAAIVEINESKYVMLKLHDIMSSIDFYPSLKFLH